jgi:hypothetical protein
VQHTKNVIKSLNESIKTDKNRIKIIFNELLDTVCVSNDILLGKALDKRLLGYARSAINRPNSRSSGMSGG